MSDWRNPNWDDGYMVSVAYIEKYIAPLIAQQERERLRRQVARIRVGVARKQVSWNSDGIWLNYLDALLADPEEADR